MSRSTKAVAAADPSLRVHSRGERPALDLGRDVHAMFGLIFDATTVDAAAAHLRHCAASGTRCFISTPNVNFAIAARSDAAFRDSVLRSDLSLADGAPIARLARMLGLPITERVAGADLFERLRRDDTERPIKVFFFGGADGVAERAAAVLNAEVGGLRCVGFCAPGFGSVEAMSSDALIEQINTSGADFVVLSIGAKKGQAWILRNRARLTAPLVSYFGAVVNFVAGSVARAPPWLRRIGLEWLWRIGQEPALWKRYAGDAWALSCMVAASLPALLWPSGLRGSRWASATLELHTDGLTALFTLRGAWTSADLPRLRRALAETLNGGATVQIDLSALQHTDAALLALIALVDRWQQHPRAIAPSTVLCRRVRARINATGLDYLIDHLERR